MSNDTTRVRAAVDAAKRQGLSPRACTSRAIALSEERALTAEEHRAATAAAVADMAACRRLAIELATAVEEELGQAGFERHPRITRAWLEFAMWRVTGGDWKELER